jgi:hypothetical protein
MALAVVHVAQPAPRTGHPQVDEVLVDYERAVYRLGTAVDSREYWEAAWRRVSALDRLAVLLGVRPRPAEVLDVDDGFSDWDLSGSVYAAPQAA